MDEIIDISKAREKFFGCSGKMLLPSSATVARMVTQVPKGKVITTTYLCQALAQQFEVQACCPVTTKKALQAMAHESGDKVAYWRVLNGKGELVNYFGSTDFDGKYVIPNEMRNPSSVNRSCYTAGMLRFTQHDNAISR